ncbi:MAG: plasmid partitioning protein RepB C-terminal domain-containing protein [Nibricoccus sp.]
MTDEMEIQMIPVGRIRVVSPRTRDPKKFERIVENISRVGLKKPITVTRGKRGQDGGEMYDLVCGQGRLEAFIALGQKEVPAFVRGFSETDSLLASLVENIARRRVRTLDQVKMIQWMKDQGQTVEDIARKTGLGEGYLKQILSMMSHGEERLLEAVLHERIPITIATKICGLTDEEAQRLLIEAYERNEMNQRTASTFKRLVEQRRYLGKSYGQRARSSHRTSAESLVRAYRQETQRQRLTVKKAKLCEVRLLSVAAAFKVLLDDDDYVTLLRAEKLQTMPKFLAQRAKEIAA